jgi:hypothetical protein
VPLHNSTVTVKLFVVSDRLHKPSRQPYDTGLQSAAKRANHTLTCTVVCDSRCGCSRRAKEAQAVHAAADALVHRAADAVASKQLQRARADLEEARKVCNIYIHFNTCQLYLELAPPVVILLAQLAVCSGTLTALLHYYACVVLLLVKSVQQSCYTTLGVD